MWRVRNHLTTVTNNNREQHYMLLLKVLFVCLFFVKYYLLKLMTNLLIQSKKTDKPIYRVPLHAEGMDHKNLQLVYWHRNVGLCAGVSQGNVRYLTITKCTRRDFTVADTVKQMEMGVARTQMLHCRGEGLEGDRGVRRKGHWSVPEQTALTQS